MPTSVANKNTDRTVPAKVGKYEIINEIGKGTTGDVYLSHDPYYGRDVAVKVYHPDTGADTQTGKVARKMFFNEAHIVGMLQHPNILPIFDAGEEDGRYYVVMEHVQGARTLAAYCNPDALLRVKDVIEIVFKCAKALHYAHGRGLIHRDIKPSNVMLTPDNDVRIIDFGIALLKDADMSAIQGIAGSPSYMSPEQVQSMEITKASDLYSLGAVMYEMLTGFRPFRGNSLAKLLNQIVYATPPPIHSLRSDVPEELEEVVAGAMQKDPSVRYASGAEFAAELTRIYQSLNSKQKDPIGEGERFSLLRRLNFFHDFSHAEIRELLGAGDWREYRPGDEIVREGEMDDRFYVIVSGNCVVEANGVTVGQMETGNCFGESSYVSGTKRTATIKAQDNVEVLSVSATLLEQLSTECQLRFNKVFLRSLIRRLHGAEDG
ncbi:MAG: serine/threonine-protein kinase [Gammaproteobacteria bacterium]|nr:serine/threonine-protein kinase [Gammaproteobacteria bacterium]MDP6616347.1 serine/threonine-protein kinase [Gammaproteobacteria bacterium]MDP6695897.1 serine/threonine-protein kinase [Gammaproteobacteria bacterium]MDP7041362.1 serine/threonine-protein kinase [Gammaproteobacteria bacterium]